MLTRKEQAILALLGAATLTQYVALQAQAQNTESSQRHRGSCDRTEPLLDEWLRLRPEAEIAAQFYEVQDHGKRARKRRRSVDPAQLHFFEEPLFAVARFYRRAGSDLALRCANANRVSMALGDEPQRWLRILRGQAGHWDEQRNLEIEQGIAALEFIVAEGRGTHEWLDWQPLELIGEPEVVEVADDEVEITVRVYNPNDTDSPIPGFLVFLMTAAGTMLIKWPNKACVPKLKSLTLKLKVPIADVHCKLKVRFAHPKEMQGAH